MARSQAGGSSANGIGAAGNAFLRPGVAPERDELGASSIPAFVRADGGVRVNFALTPRGTRPMRIAESGGYRVRFPDGDRCEAVLINTGGGMAGGDRMTVALSLGEGAETVVTTQSAEKLYRADAASAEIAIGLEIGRGGNLAWLPQPTILFSASRVRRLLNVAMAEEASLILAESIVFGRIASGEVMGYGTFRDSWQVRRGGKLVFAEEVRLEGDIDRILSKPAIAGGGRAVATLLLVAPDAEARIDAVRAALGRGSCESGASSWNGMLVARLLSPDAQALRGDLVRLLEDVRGKPMPRSWQT